MKITSCLEYLNTTYGDGSYLLLFGKWNKCLHALSSTIQ